MSKTYEIEIVNWIWQSVKTRRDMFYFTDHEHPRIKRFKTQKAARAWLESAGFTPIFGGKRPSTYRSMQRGMQATIRECRKAGYPAGTTEGRIQKAIINGVGR